MNTKRIETRHLVALAVAGALAGGMSTPVHATLPAPILTEPETRPKDPVPARPAITEFGKAAQARMEWERQHRASRIIGSNVRSPDGERIGDITDIVLDDEGRIAYAVITKGGFMGLAARLHAVPWSALTHPPSQNFLVLDIDREQLRAAHRFMSDNWPGFSEVAMTLESEPGAAPGSDTSPDS